MANYFQFLFFVLFNSLYFTLCQDSQHSCRPDQSFHLLKFKETFSIKELSSYSCFQSSYPKTSTWDNNTNCCSWDGITCDEITGNVVEIDLSCSQLKGTIGYANSLFRLSHLRRLNLAYNEIESSNIFGNFTHLTHLNLSSNAFAGQVSSDILKLRELTSLDLSYNGFTVGPDIFKLVLTNFTKLSQVDLTNLCILSSIPENLSASLEIVELGFNNLQGKVPETIFHLPYLDRLVLGSNPRLFGLLPSVRWNSSATLEWLDLSGTLFRGEIPESVLTLEVLKNMNLSSCGFNGSLPAGMFSNMTQIETIDLSSNKLVGSLPSFPRATINLKILILANNSFSGTIMSSWLFSLSSLEFLGLNSNQLSGNVPVELSSLVNLRLLDLSSNNFSGHVDVDIFSNMKQLLILSLSHNRLSLVTNNSSILPKSIHTLELASCNITELEFLRNPPEYSSIDLSMNNLQEVPSWLWSKWTNISRILNISYNSITHIEGIHSHQITVLDIRSNLVRGPFPQLPASIEVLLISNNKFFGVIPPSIICRLSSVRMIDLSNNSFSGSIPQCVVNMSQHLSILDVHMNDFEGTIANDFFSTELVTLNLHGNRLRGNIPSSLTQCINLKDLDLGNNHLNGTFPSWLGVLPELRVLNLRSNNFHDEVSVPLTPTSFSKLQILDLSHNHFTGTLPEMLFKSFSGMMEIDETSGSASYIGDSSYYKVSIILVNKGIQVQLTRILKTWTTIDLSYNNFKGNIPSSIGSLIYLRQLNVSNNRFDGEIPISFGNLSLLESLDVSSNQLIGTIPTQLQLNIPFQS